MAESGLDVYAHNVETVERLQVLCFDHCFDQCFGQFFHQCFDQCFDQCCDQFDVTCARLQGRVRDHRAGYRQVVQPAV